MIDLRDFQGEWQAVWVEEDGRKRHPDEVRRTRVRITGDRYTLDLGGQGVRGVLVRAEVPGQIDFRRDPGPDGPGATYRALYLIEGDELTVAVAPPGKERPTDLDCRAGSGHRLYLLRRVSPDPFAAESQEEAGHPVGAGG